MSKFDDKLNLDVDELLKSICDDIQSLIPIKERKQLPAEVILWQLFVSPKFKNKFSLKMLAVLLQKINIPSEKSI